MPSSSDRAFARTGDPPLEWREALLAFGSEPLSNKPAEDDPDRVLKRLLPHCRRFGITRLADITGLDRLGLPVVQAFRPAALSEVTALGRGRSMAQAAIGAIMEACERYFAEAIAPDLVFTATADDLGIAPGLFDGVRQPDCADGWRRLALPWIMGIDVSSGNPAPVPLELVHTRYCDPPPEGDGVFIRSTTGLACHNSAGQALLHGLFECIERDALGRAFETHGFFDRYRIGPQLGVGTELLVRMASDAGISVAFWQMPSPTGLPAIWCQTIETAPAEPILAIPTEGYSARESIAAAAEDALREALVTRAASVSGARDDQTARHYRAGRSAGALTKARDLIVQSHAMMELTEAELSKRVDPAELTERVAASGLGPIFAVPVGEDREAGIVCVRTVLGAARAFSIAR